MKVNRNTCHTVHLYTDTYILILRIHTFTDNLPIILKKLRIVYVTCSKERE